MTNYLWGLLLAVGGGVGAVFLAILINHFINYWRQKTFDQRKEKWETLFFNYLEGNLSVSETAEKMGSEYYLLWNFLESYSKNLKGEDFHKLNQLVTALGMKNFFLTKLKQGRKRAKVKAAVIFGKLREKEAVPYLEEMLASDAPEVVIAAGRAIAEIGEVKLAFPILRALFNRTYITFEGTSQLMADFGIEICEPIVDLIREWLAGKIDLEAEFGVPEYQPLALFVDLLGYNQYPKAVELMADLLSQCQNEEVIIHVFKALARIQMPVEVNLTPFLNHQNWVIRSQAAKFISTVPTKDYTAQLRQLLADEDWWVKFHAGKALLNLGQKELLEELAGSEEPGAEMSRYILDAGDQVKL